MNKIKLRKVRLPPPRNLVLYVMIRIHNLINKISNRNLMNKNNNKQINKASKFNIIKNVRLVMRL